MSKVYGKGISPEGRATLHQATDEGLVGWSSDVPRKDFNVDQMPWKQLKLQRCYLSTCTASNMGEAKFHNVQLWAKKLHTQF